MAAVIPRQLIRITPERRRLLADWNSRDQASIVREVIGVADEWFTYTTESAEREVAAAALAAEPPRLPKGPTGPTGPTGPRGAAPNVPGPIETAKLREELQKLMQNNAGQSEETREKQKQFLESLKRHMETMKLGSAQSGPLYRLSTPGGGDEGIQHMFPSFAGRAALGTPEDASDGLGGLSDYVTEPKVSR